MHERDRAEEDLRVIRTLMERATIYRAISAPTALAGGVIAITLAAFIWVREHHWAETAPEVMRHISTRVFASLWLGALAIVLTLNTFFVRRKAQRDCRPVHHGDEILADGRRHGVEGAGEQLCVFVVPPGLVTCVSRRCAS